MSGYDIREALEADDAAIRDLIRQSAQPGRVVLNFEREPSFHAGARVTCEQPDIWVAIDKKNGQYAALANIGRRALYVNGERHNIRYAHDLRVADPYRGTLVMVRMFRGLKTLVSPNEWMQTVILAENEKSLSTVGSGRAGLPRYFPCGDIVTHLVFAAPLVAIKHDLDIRRASAADLPAMQALLDEQGPKRQFFPCYDLKKILEGNSYYKDIKIDNYWLAWRGDVLEGMVGVWDQKSFKQTRLIQYPRGLSWLRHVYNIWTFMFGGMRLPAAGGVIRYRTLHTVVTRGDQPKVLSALVEPIAHRARQSRIAVVCAFFSNDPMRESMRKFRTQVLSSKHFLMSFGEDPRADLDDRIPYVEVSRL
jgi:hypothetical protein